MARYAIVRSGGKQYRVEEGRTIDVERLPAPEGERVELKDVLLLADDASVTVGTPTVPEARVIAEVVAHGRQPKITVFRYKAKVRYRKKTGHRQAFTRLAIQRIQMGEEEAPTAEKKPAARRRARRATAEIEVAPEPATTGRPRRAAPKVQAALTEGPATAPARRSRRKTPTESGE